MKKNIKSLRLVVLLALLAIACQFSTAFAQDTLYVCSGGLVVYKRAVLQIDSLTHTKPKTLPALSATTAISSITPTTATSGGNITSDGGAAVTARGVCWSTAASPTVSLTTKTTDGSGTGTFTSSITGLTANTTYYVRSYATNSVGTAYGTQLSFTTITAGATTSACGAYLGASNTNYKQFLCKNLGATGDLYSGGLTYVAAENGDLYQWGRPTDGHEKRNSTTTATLATTNTPGNANFILAPSPPNDWRSGGGEITSWTDATKAANDPCPLGYKVPSQSQWAGVVANNVSTWVTGYKFGANLFLPASGYRNNNDGSLGNVGSIGYYWSSTVSGTGAYDLLFYNGFVNAASNGQRASGFSVRCIAE